MHNVSRETLDSESSNRKLNYNFESFISKI